MPNAHVIIEHNGREIDDTSFELAHVARQLTGDGGKVTALLAGHGVSALTPRIVSRFDEIRLWDDERLEVPDGDQLRSVYATVIEREAPDIVLAAHTNNGIDLVPGLAVRLGRPLLTDCITVSFEDGVLSAIRPVYGGKAHVRVSAARSDRGYFATLRPGTVRPGAIRESTAEITEEKLAGPLPNRRRFVRTVAADVSDVDISQAERLVAVGRGIEDEEGLDIIRRLADALGAEVACSRPVVDKQWLPKSRQVGTSGKSVKPKLYVAVGISGSFQHMGGIKGDPFLVAINKDPRAPIFAVADVGIVGDLFDIVPVLEEKIRAMKR